MRRFLRKLGLFLIILPRNELSNCVSPWSSAIYLLCNKGQWNFDIHPQCRDEYLKHTFSNALQEERGNLALVKKSMPYLRLQKIREDKKFSLHPQVISIFEKRNSHQSHPTSFQLEKHLISALSGMGQIILLNVDIRKCSTSIVFDTGNFIKWTYKCLAFDSVE